MASEWYYTQHGHQQGPVPALQIKEMAAAGTLNAADLVWNDTMTEWVPASRVKGLVFHGATGPAAFPELSVPSPVDPNEVPLAAVHPGPAQSLAYEAPPRDAAITHRTVELLSQTRPWVLFMAILGFIAAGLMILGGIVMVVGAAMSQAGGGEAAVLGAAMYYVVSGGIYALISTLLLRFSARIADVKRLRRTVDLEAALDAQRSFWKLVGILTIIGVGLIVIGLIIVAVVFALR